MGTEGFEETVREYYRRIDADDYEAVFELFAEGVIYHRPGQPPIEGKPDLRRFYLDERPLSAGTHEIHGTVVGEDTVAVRGRFAGEQDGDPVELGFADFHRLKDGRIVERHTYTDRDEV